jgi:putative transposase
LLVAKVHEKIANQRRDFHFKTANNLVKQYDVIFHEDLDINSMFSFRNINRNIMDAAWKQFLDILSFKAEEAGKKIIKIKSQSTTETCSTCGNIVPVDLTTRIFFCPHCNISIDRDYNAALNILRLGVNHLDSRIAPEKSIIR